MSYFRSYIKKNNTIIRGEPEKFTTPVIYLNGSHKITLPLGEQYIDEGYYAYDEKYGEITDNVIIDSNLDVNTIGSYTIRYNVLNDDGVPAIEVTRVVNVEIVWTYEGTLTVGIFQSEWGEVLYGASSSYGYGDLNPIPDLTNYFINWGELYSKYAINLMITSESYYAEITALYIDGKIYTERELAFGIFFEEPVNPFSIEGSEHEIKFVYHLVTKY